MLEEENARFKRSLADAMLDNAVPEETAAKEPVKPAARRRTVEEARQRCGISKRRACSIFGVDRTSVCYGPRRSDDGDLRSRLREITAERRRFGYRRLGIMLAREGLVSGRPIRILALVAGTSPSGPRVDREIDSIIKKAGIAHAEPKEAGGAPAVRRKHLHDVRGTFARRLMTTPDLTNEEIASNKGWPPEGGSNGSVVSTLTTPLETWHLAAATHAECKPELQPGAPTAAESALSR